MIVRFVFIKLAIIYLPLLHRQAHHQVETQMCLSA